MSCSRVPNHHDAISMSMDFAGIDDQQINDENTVPHTVPHVHVLKMFPSQFERRTQPCAVCGEETSERRFQVRSCNSCQKFINSTSRAVISCTKDEKCEITKKTRTACRFCRFKKCVITGMAGQRCIEKFYEANPTVNFFVAQVTVAKTTVTEHFEPNWLNDEQLEQIVRDIINANEKDQVPRGCANVRRILKYHHHTTLLGEQMNAWRAFSAEMSQELNDILTFVRHLNPQDGLTQDERITLIKRNLFPIFLLRNASGISDHGIILPNGCLIDKMDLFVLFGKMAVDQISTLAWKIKNLACGKIPIYILTILVFYQPFNAAKMPKYFKNFENLLTSFDFYQMVLGQKMMQFGRAAMMQLLMMIHELEELNDSLSRVIRMLRHNKEHFENDQLFMEMFNVKDPIEYIEKSVVDEIVLD